MFCGECGAALEKDAKFCEKCGAKVEKEKPQKNEDEEIETLDVDLEIKEKSHKSEKKTEDLEEKKEKPVKENSQKRKQKNSNKLTFIIILIILLVAIGGYFIYKYIDKNKPIEEKWGQKYYVYLKEMNEKEKNKKAGLPYNLNKAKISFIETKDIDDPVMIIKYKKDNENFSNVYYIKNDKVNTLVYEQPTDIKYLYNIKDDSYDYYVHIKEDDTNIYKTITEQIEQPKEEKDVYTFYDGDKELVIDDDGDELSISKFDKTFVDTQYQADELTYKDNLEEEEIKQVVKSAIKKYKTEDEILEEIEDDTKKDVEKIEAKEEQIKKAFGTKVLTCNQNNDTYIDISMELKIGFIDDEAKNVRIYVVYDLEDNEYITADEVYKNLQESFDKLTNDNIKTNMFRDGNNVTGIIQGRISEVSDFLGLNDDLTGKTYSAVKTEAEESKWSCK